MARDRARDHGPLVLHLFEPRLRDDRREDNGVGEYAGQLNVCIGSKADIAPEGGGAVAQCMANGAVRAEFWKEFVTARCDYPAADRLRAQLAEAKFFDFCDCGCNSFAVKATESAPLLVPSGGGAGHRAIFTADFKMADERTLEIILFADDSGNLDYIEVDCCANSYPVPDVIEADAAPFQTWASEGLLR